MRTPAIQEHPMTKLARQGASLLGLAFFLVLVPIGVRVAWLTFRGPAVVATAGADLEVQLLRAGLDSHALAAAGLSAQEASALVDAFASAVAEAPAALANADASYVSARKASDELTRKVASGLASQEEITALSQAKGALEAAKTARTQVLDGWFNDATVALSAPKANTLALLRVNHGRVPAIELLVKERSDAEWHAIHKALNNERIAAKIGDEPNQAQQTALAAWRADPACATAKTNHDSNSSAVKTAWLAAVNE
jgi:hypothetical protein